MNDFRKLLKDFQEGQTIRFLPKPEAIDLWDQTKYWVPRSKAKAMICQSGETYVPGKCPVCDYYFEELYLEEYNDCVLWI